MEKVLDREKGPLSGFMVKPPYRCIVPRPWLGLVPEWARRFLLPEFLLRTHVWVVHFNGNSAYFKSQEAANCARRGMTLRMGMLKGNGEEMITPEELALVETKELYEEIARRSCACLIVMNFSRTETESETRIFWDGGEVMALGLAEYTKQHILRKNILRDAENSGEEG